MKKFVCAVMLAGIFPAFGDPVGQVISVVPGAFVERGGKVAALDIKSEIDSNDILITDQTGRVRIIFADNGSVNVGSDTRIALIDVMPGGAKPKFAANIAKGVGRFITGEIVKNNPDGYNIKTPKATIGIRGTIFAIQVADDGMTRLSVLQTANKVVFNKTDVRGGQKISTKPGAKIEKLAQGDLAAITDMTSVENKENAAMAAKIAHPLPRAAKKDEKPAAAAPKACWETDGCVCVAPTHQS